MALEGEPKLHRGCRLGEAPQFLPLPRQVGIRQQRNRRFPMLRMQVDRVTGVRHRGVLDAGNPEFRDRTNEHLGRTEIAGHDLEHPRMQREHPFHHRNHLVVLLDSPLRSRHLVGVTVEVLVRVGMQDDGNLTEVARAPRPSAVLDHLGDGWNHHGREDPDDRADDQDLDQGVPSAALEGFRKPHASKGAQPGPKYQAMLQPQWPVPEIRSRPVPPR